MNRTETPPERRRRALVSAVALGALALGIYAVVIMKFFVYK